MAYPSSIDSFSTKVTGDTIQASHVNDLQTATVALETKVGITGSAVTSTIDYLLTNASSTSPGHKHVVADITNAGAFIVTGLILPYTAATAPTGFLLCDGTAVSRTTYAALFAVTSTNFGVGDGATTFNVPDMRSRFIMGAGTAGTKVFTFVSRASNVITASGMASTTTNENQTGQAVTYATSGTEITGLTNNTVYYIVRTAATTFSLATTLTNAQNGVVITLSGDGSGTQTFTFALTARTLATTGGEETHAMSSTELLAHTHLAIDTAGADGTNAVRSANAAGPTATSSTGGNAAMNITSPFLALTYVIKT